MYETNAISFSGSCSICDARLASRRCEAFSCPWICSSCLRSDEGSDVEGPCVAAYRAIAGMGMLGFGGGVVFGAGLLAVGVSSGCGGPLTAASVARSGVAGALLRPEGVLSRRDVLLIRPIFLPRLFILSCFGGASERAAKALVVEVFGWG